MSDSPVQPTANIGVVGLAVMGSNLARNLASREGNTVAVYNRSRSKTDELLAEVKQAYDNLQDQAHALYKSMYAGGLSYYDAINQNMAIGTPSEELAKLLSDYSAEVLVTLTKQPSDDAEPFQDEPAE